MGASPDIAEDLASAQRNLTTAVDKFTALGHEIQQKYKYIVEREVSLVEGEANLEKAKSELSEREKRCKQREIEVEERCKQREIEMEEKCKQREDEVKHRCELLEREVDDRCKEKEVEMDNKVKQTKGELWERWLKVCKEESEWEELSQKLNDNVAKVGDVVELDVGGKLFKTSKNTLLRHEGSFFSVLFKSDLFQQSKPCFIDRAPKYFEAILNLLRDGELVERVSLEQFRKECEFYKIPLPLGLGLKLAPQVLKEIKAWVPDKKFQLIYKATKDKFSAAAFHSKCDNKGPTLTIIQSKDGYLFGGYSPDPWNSNNTYKSNPATFIFTLTNPHSIPPTQLFYESGRAIECFTHLSASFGSDISICDNSHQQQNSFFNFPRYFKDSTKLGYKLFTGTNTFITQEIEVYSVVG